MEKKRLICKKFVKTTGDVESFVLEYYLVETEVLIGSSNISSASFGALVLKTYNNGFSEEEAAFDICLSEKEAIGFIHKIAENTVTPATLSDVVYDYLS